MTGCWRSWATDATMVDEEKLVAFAECPVEAWYRMGEDACEVMSIVLDAENNPTAAACIDVILSDEWPHHDRVKCVQSLRTMF